MHARKETTLGVVHVTGHKPGWGGGIEGVRAAHLARGWSDIGYHVVIDTDGSVYQGRDLWRVGAGVAGYNSTAIHVALIGGVNGAGEPDADAITDDQWDMLEDEMTRLTAEYPGIQWCGHRDLSPDLDGDGVIEPHEHVKACPTFDVLPWAAERGLPVAPISGAWDANDPRRPRAPDAREAWLQRLLVRLGYELGPVDGLVGARTRAAIEEFQRDRKLPVTGRFDRVTVERLRAAVEAGEDHPRPKVAKRVEDAPKPTDGGVAATGGFGGLGLLLTSLIEAPVALQIAVGVAVVVLALLIARALGQAKREVALAKAGAEVEVEPDWLDWAEARAVALLRRIAGLARRGLGPIARPLIGALLDLVRRRRAA